MGVGFHIFSALGIVSLSEQACVHLPPVPCPSCAERRLLAASAGLRVESPVGDRSVLCPWPLGTSLWRLGCLEALG